MNDRGHILVVDDEPLICESIGEYLASEGYRVSIAHDAAGMRQSMAQSRVDLILLDLKLPKDDGLALARALRNQTDIGIIMMTGRSETTDRIIGLEMGADDYLAKPFHLAELLARIKSVLRRISRSGSGSQGAARPQVHFAGWSFCTLSRDLRSPSGEPVRLTTGEFDLLSAFVANPNRVMTRDRLLELVRNRAAGPFDRTIDVQVGRLRRKLADNAEEPNIIKTVRGSGYIFTAKVETRI